MENQEEEIMIINVVSIGVSVILLLIIVNIYYHSRNKKIQEIIKYIEAINNKNYDLKIAENTEDDLSNFRNELYKIAIMLKEQASQSINDKKALQTSLEDISHQLKTPLTSIRGYSETIMNGDLTYQEIIKFSKVINQEANRMSRLVSDLLQLSKMDYNRVNWNKATLNTVDILKKVCEKVRFEAEEKKHKLELICAENTPTIYADKDSIEQIVINILTNSIKYTPEGGLIRIYAGPIDNRVYIKVIDNGIGIPQKDLGRIFERFYRVDKARSRKMGGTGLGLSIVKEMVDRNNGTINIDSKLNEGTEVTMTFPVNRE